MITCSKGLPTRDSVTARCPSDMSNPRLPACATQRVWSMCALAQCRLRAGRCFESADVERASRARVAGTRQVVHVGAARRQSYDLSPIGPQGLHQPCATIMLIYAVRCKLQIKPTNQQGLSRVTCLSKHQRGILTRARSQCKCLDWACRELLPKRRDRLVSSKGHASIASRKGIASSGARK